MQPTKAQLDSLRAHPDLAAKMFNGETLTSLAGLPFGDCQPTSGLIFRGWPLGRGATNG